MEFGFASGQSTSIGGGGYSIAGGFDNWTVTLHTATVPEPSTWVLLGLGLPALLAFRRRKGA